MKKWLDTKSLKFKLWVYFGMFALAIMLILWILQIILLGTFYETMKKAEVEKLGRQLVSEFGKEGFEQELYQTAFRNGISVRLIDQEGKLVSSTDQFFGVQANHPRQLLEHIDRVKQSKNGLVIYTIDDGPMRGHNVVYGAKLIGPDNTPFFLYMTAPLAPIDATSQVLQNQLIIITVLSLILSLALAFFLARRISRPIIRITDSANILAEGDLTVKFDQGNYTEINELSNSLNHMATELTKTDQLRRDLIANVSHDLKTPLTVIRSYAEMIRDLSGENPEKRSRHAQVIADEADRLSLLVNDILDLSKLESGVSELQKTRFDLSSLTHQIIERFRIVEESRGYSFQFDCLSKDLYVLADLRRIEQVIYNLIGNAVSYTGADKNVRVEVKKKGDQAYFGVIDSGAGIPAEEQKLVFERYYRASKQGHRSTFGSGIGLSIVKEILIAHQVPYGVKSEEGIGSTFWFMLDLTEKTETKEREIYPL